MYVELAVDAVLFLFFIVCYRVVGATTPPASVPGCMSAASWPHMVLACLIVTLAINMVKIVKVIKKTGCGNLTLKELFPVKVVVGFIGLGVYVFAMNYLGFIPSTFLLVIFLSMIFGLKKKGPLILSAFISTLGMYIVFKVFLQVLLPTGVGAFRSFSLFVETLF